jgi:hypothetical protein
MRSQCYRTGERATPSEGRIVTELPGSIIAVTLKCALIGWLLVSAIGVVHSLLQ